MDECADYRYVLDACKVDDFKERLRSRNCTQMLDQMKFELEQSIILSDSVDESIRTFVITFENCAKPLFQKNIYVNDFCRGDGNGQQRGHAPWLMNVLTTVLCFIDT